MQIRTLLGNAAHKAGLVNYEQHIRIPNVRFLSGLGDGAWLLYGLVRSMKPEVCVEIGSARGLSACYVGLALSYLKQGKLYAIDPHTRTAWNDRNSINTYEVMQKNLQAFQVSGYVEIIQQYSDKAAEDWDKPIDMLFIDGDHSYEGVKRDWELFVPHMRKFGVVIFHDTIWDLQPDPQWTRDDMGVPYFVEELRERGYPVITLDQHCGISLVQPVLGGIKLSR